MDVYKREVFADKHPGVEFPWCKEISRDESRHLCERLAKEFLIPDTAGSALTEFIGTHSRYVKGVNACHDTVRLDQIIAEHGIALPEHVYLNYGLFDTLDCMRFQDVVAYLPTFWLPASDDMDVFDDTCRWLLLIDHDGNIRIMRSNKSRDCDCASRTRSYRNEPPEKCQGPYYYRYHPPNGGPTGRHIPLH